MIVFRDLKQFADFLVSLVPSLPAAERRGLEAASTIIEREATREIGHYQDAAGPFPAWAELADSTKKERAALGFTKDDPLLRTGELLHSIGHVVEGREAAIGSDSDISVYQELGTHGGRGMAGDATGAIPPRSFLGGAAVRMTDRAVDALSAHVVEIIAGRPASNRDPDSPLPEL